ncbi:DHHW family protein [Aurantibacter sp.]|uniref:DHHW family protein n=1 Tax=Aurantibacter sp. TaxID=2807103 RepID=UPI003262D8A1
MPLLLAILVFFTIKVLIGTLKSKPEELAIQVNAKVLADDTFQVFYLNEKAKVFNEEQSVISEVKGDSILQTIRFKIPLDTSINKLRLDIGKNRKQKPIEITSFILANEFDSLTYDISKDFNKNICIGEENGKFITKTISNSYDPFFISKFNAKAAILNLTNDKPLVHNFVAYLISFVFALAFLLSATLNNFSLNRLSPNAYTLFFILIILAPQCAKLLDSTAETSNEKRKLAKKPEWNFKESYPKAFEAYYNDNFGLRPLLISWSSKFKIKFFKDSPKPELAQFGKDGYIFFNEYEEKSGGIYSSYSNTNLASEKELNNALQKHKRIKNELAHKNIEYVFGSWPNKHTIYNDLLPYTMKLQLANKTSLADQTVSYFEKAKLPMFDVRKDLLNNKNKKQLYYKFDTHWNANGAYEGYHAFCKQTFDQLGLKPFPLEEFEVSTTPIRKGDLTKLMGIDSISSHYDVKPLYELKNDNKNFHFIYPGGIYKNGFVTINDNCGNNKTALVFRDSYGSALIQFLSLHYAKVIYVARSQVDMYWVNKTNPDVVILGVVERRLPYLLDIVE